MTTIIIISCLIIGAIGGAWWQHHRDVKDKRILANRNIDLINTVAELSEYKNNVSVVEHYAIKKENEALKFQIQQYNIDKTDGKQPETKG